MQLLFAVSRSTFVRLLILLGMFSGYSPPIQAGDVPESITLAGSTPVNEFIRSLLDIPPQNKIDFARWKVRLDDRSAFVLDMTFGEIAPNTLRFKNGGTTRSFRGKYHIEPSADKNHQIYRLHFSKDTMLGIARLNSNLFHILNKEDALMIGDDGWSYTLNRKPPADAMAAGLSVPSTSTIAPAAPIDNNQSAIVYGGRTPCAEIARDYALGVTAGCFKLKWKFTLYTDPATRAPKSYVLKRTGHRSDDIAGTWSVIKSAAPGTDIKIYRLEPDKRESLGKPIYLFAASKDVLFFVDDRERPYIGNEDFSYTLNRMN